MPVLRKLLEYFLTSKLWVYLARYWVAYLTFRVYGYPSFPMEKYFDIQALLKANPNKRYGFVCADTHSLAWVLTHMITRAKWGHAGVLYLDGEHVRMSHMKGDGLNDWHVLSELRACDHFAVLELEFAGPESQEIFDKRFKFVKEISTQADYLEYDYTMSLNSKVFDWINLGILDSAVPTAKKFRLYCSEYLYALTEGLVPTVIAKEFQGRMMHEPDDAYKCNKVVFEA